MKKIILLTICLLQSSVFQLFANDLQTKPENIKVISETFAKLDQKNQYADQLNQVDMNILPMGFKQTISNNEFAIALSSIVLLESHAEVTLFARMKTAQGKTPLFFAAQGVKFSYDGNIIGDASLVLVEDLDIPINGHTRLKLLGGGFDTNTGRSETKTFVTVGCSGFKELSIAGSLIFSDSLIQRVSPKGDILPEPVSADFQTIVSGWNDLLVEISLPTFQIKGLDGFIFNLSKAVFDFSDLQNSTTVKFPEGYAQKYLVGDSKLWRGVFAQNLSITLPKEFSKEGQSATFAAQNLLIDDNGISGLFSAENVLPINIGSASGWSFSIDKFLLGLEAHKITQAGFEGLLGLPVSDNTYLKYKAQILGNKNYQLIVQTQDTLSFDCFLAKAHLLPNSYVKMEVVNGKFLPEACLNGYLSINTAEAGDKDTKVKAKFDNIEFRNLVLKTESPYLTVDYMGYKGEINLMGFPVSVSDIKFTSTEKNINLGFGLALNLDKNHISASTYINLKGKYDTNRSNAQWLFDGIGIEDLALKNCKIGGVLTLNGKLKIMDQDPLYGDGFYGDLSIKFDKVMQGCEINMAAAFGKKDVDRYWFVDGSMTFPKPINIVGPLGLNGFGGGLSSGMKRTPGKGLGASKTGCGYIPNKDMGLGLKAAVYFASDGGSLNGNASFEIQFNRGGGVDLIGFFGYAEFMAEIPGLEEVSKEISGRFNDLVDMENNFVDKLGKVGDLLTQTKQYEPSKYANETTDAAKLASQANFAASVGLIYDFSAETLHGNFDVYVNAAGGLIRGTASGNRAGWAVLHISPQEWYIHIGTPSDRIGLQVGIPGIASLKTTAYFMMGDNIPGSPAPPEAVSRILGEKNETYNYMRDLNALKAGRGIAFGTSLDFSTGDLNFLVLYARFDAGVGFDIMMKDYGNAQCKGRSGPIGINGWYANGQAYAYLSGELGVKVNLWFTKGKFPIIKGGAAALLQAKLPNPTWFRGDMGVNYNILGGAIKGKMRFKFTVGDECEIMLPGTSPIDFPMISDLSPEANTSDVDVFTAPQLALTMSLQKTFEADFEDGKKEFRINLNKFVVKDGSAIINGDLSWNNDKTVVTFYPSETLPPNKQLKIEAAVGFQELKNNQWINVFTSGVLAQETRDIQFTTGTAPDHVPLHNVVYAYPMVDQNFYYPGESKTGKGYVQLRTGQEYLFPANWKYKVVFADESGRSKKEVPFTYNIGSKRLIFDLPKLDPKNRYEIGFVSESASTNKNPETMTKETILLKDDENLVVQHSAKSNIIIQESEGKLLLNYQFASSKFNTFKDKVDNAKVISNGSVYFGPYLFQLTQGIQSVEPFDDAEVYGTPASGNQPLVKIKSMLTDQFYQTKISPMLYKGYPIAGIRLNREDGEIEIPPANAFERKQEQGWFPFYYTLPRYYYYDFDEMRTKAANSFVDHPALKATYFPDIISGTYLSELQYYLPGGEEGKSKVNFKYTVKK